MMSTCNLSLFWSVGCF